MKTKKTSKPKAAKPAPKKTGKHLSAEHKAKISEACRGLTPWNKNKKTGLTPSNKGKRWDKKLRKYVSRKRKADKSAD